ncbi:hypothetical protein NMG60_11020125 [Bertholletia excelsa]
MSKAAVHILLTAAFVLLTVQNLKPNHRARLARGPNRRLGIKQRHQLFDPLVAQMTQESGLEDPNLATASWETTPFPREIPVGDLDRFLGEGKLNMTLRLMYLFPYVDKEPKDGFVEADELQAWILQQATDRLACRTRKELAARDKNGDLEISLQECLPRLFEEDPENGIEEEEVRWWREQFNNADADKNEHLNFFELRDFLFPEDSNNEKIHAWLIREKIKTTDYDNDEKINLEEFKDGIFDMYTNYYEFENGEASLPTSEDLFEELDLNKDGYYSSYP